jgi:hypothetical protein
MMLLMVCVETSTSAIGSRQTCCRRVEGWRMDDQGAYGAALSGVSGCVPHGYQRDGLSDWELSLARALG